MSCLNEITLNVIILSLLVIILAYGASEAQRTHVSFTNRLPASVSRKNLTIHCKSKNDDLGFHTIMPGPDKFYEFEFWPDWLWRTLFFCSFTWPNEPSLHYLDVYHGWEDRKCKNLWWKIDDCGGCKSCDLLDNPHVCYRWIDHLPRNIV